MLLINQLNTMYGYSIDVQSCVCLVTEKLISIIFLYHIPHSMFMENLSLCLFFISLGFYFNALI